MVSVEVPGATAPHASHDVVRRIIQALDAERSESLEPAKRPGQFRIALFEFDSARVKTKRRHQRQARVAEGNYGRRNDQDVAVDGRRTADALRDIIRDAALGRSIMLFAWAGERTERRGRDLVRSPARQPRPTNV